MFPHAQLLFGVLIVAVAALVAWSFWMLPRWSRPGIYFAVTVPLPFLDSPQARAILRGYRLRAMLHVALGFGLIVGGALVEQLGLLALGCVWLVGGPLAAFLRAHQRVMPFAVEGSTVRQAVLEPRHTQPAGGWLAQAGPFAILIAVAIYLQFRWNDIPARFPVHWGIDGQPNGWSTRTPMGVYAALITSLVVVAGMAVAAYGIRNLSRNVDSTTIGSVAHDFAHRMGIFLLIMEYFLAMTFSLVALLPLTGSPGAMSVAVMAFLMLPVLLMLIPWLNKGRAHDLGGSLVTLGAAPVGDGTLDEHWKMGIFYFNRDDAALFVEKRFGIGYTLNFAHPSAWICMIVVLLLPVAALLLIWHQR